MSNLTEGVRIQPPAGDSVMLSSGGGFAVHFADGDEWRPGNLGDRELAVFLGLVDLVAEKLRKEQAERRTLIAVAKAFPREATR